MIAKEHFEVEMTKRVYDKLMNVSELIDVLPVAIVEDLIDEFIEDYYAVEIENGKEEQAWKEWERKTGDTRLFC